MDRCRVLLCLCLLLREVCSEEGTTAVSSGWPLCPTEPGVRCQPDKSSALEEYAYSVEGSRVIMEFLTGGYFSLRCGGNVTLDSRSLPRFSAPLQVAAVTLRSCPPPADPTAGSYAAALARLNVTVLTKLVLYNATLDRPLLRSHFADLAHLTDLIVVVKTAPVPEAGFLAELKGLRSLRLEALRLRPTELERLPTGLENLHLIRLGVERVTTAVLIRLPLLQVLTVRDVIKVEIELNETRSVRVVTLDAPGAPAPMSPGLERATVWRWGEVAPEPWTACDQLTSLQLVLPALKSLPPEWVSQCGRLSTLLVSHAVLHTLPRQLLSGASRLREFNVTSCQLRSLPTDLFMNTPELRTINLSHNELLTLPSNLFSRADKLASLDLSDNNLSREVIPLVSWLPALRMLFLGKNPIGDLCGGSSNIIQANDLSSLHSMTQLERVSLSRAGVTRVCFDWRRTLLRLDTLDLSNNNITQLTYEDLQFRRGINYAKVDLTGNPVESVKYTYSDYKTVQSRKDYGSQWSRPLVLLDSLLKCDCLLYWAAQALVVRPDHVRVSSLRCGREGGAAGQGAGWVALEAARAEDMLCDTGDDCPAGCQCGAREQAPEGGAEGVGEGEGRAPGSVVRVECEGAGRTAAPRLARRAGRRWELLLRNNNISDLRLEDLPQDLQVIDLRNNSVRTLEADVVSALLQPARRRVLLAGNPLECGCGAALPPALALHRARLDYRALRCADLRDVAGLALPLAAAPSAADCSRRARLRLGLALGAAAALALPAAAALAAWLLRPELRLRVKAALHARGLLPRRALDGEGEGEGERYDAFVSYSHRDEAVARALVARLEAGGYAVCVHYRDWAPGEWIPAQIAASVRASRRTLALVSAAWLRSAWARAEFREARAHALRAARPTLLAVLLEPLPAAALDAHPDLRAFLAANTYVEWTDPWFWEKLIYAMPPLRRRGEPRRPPHSSPDSPPETEAPPSSASLELSCAPASDSNLLPTSAAA